MRLIDADTFMEECRNRIEVNAPHLPLYIRDFVIDEMPTVEAEPVRHGRWKENNNYSDTYYECTSCGELFAMIEGTPIENGYNYCPNCGAKMDGEVEHG